jgi:hypothetical protein
MGLINRVLVSQITVSFSGTPVGQSGKRAHSLLAEYYEQSPYGGASFDPHSRRSSVDSDRNSLYRGSSVDQRPLVPLNPSLISVNNYHNNGSPVASSSSLHPRRSSESMRVMPTQPKAASHSQDRAFSFSSGERPDMCGADSTQSRPFSQTSASSAVVPRRSPVVYPALLSRVAEAFKTRITVSERVKDGLVYPDTFDGRDAVDKIAYIIKTSDRNLALLLGRALDAQKFFHDVTYDHRLRDSPIELYQFRERLASPFLSSDGLAPTDDCQDGSHVPAPPRSSDTDTAASSEDSIPSGVFTLLTDCYSPTCTRDRLCYSIACPRRLEQQARLNLKPKPGLQRSVSSESLGDLRVRLSETVVYGKRGERNADDSGYRRSPDRSGSTPCRRTSPTRRRNRRRKDKRLSTRSFILNATLFEIWSTCET